MFEAPSRVPVLKEGEQEVTILAGVKRNGSSGDRTVYPFYAAYSEQRELVPAQVDTIFPVVTYREGVQFVWMEDFEDNTISMETTGSTVTYDSIYVTDDPEDVFEYDGDRNRRSGRVDIPANGFNVFENSSVGVYDLPRRGQEIFLEVNFKSNIDFTVGIYPIKSGPTTGIPIVVFYSTEDESGEMKWKKGYVSLSREVNTSQNIGADFKVFFNAETNTTEGSPTLLLDNIKLIHF